LVSIFIYFKIIVQVLGSQIGFVPPKKISLGGPGDGTSL